MPPREYWISPDAACAPQVLPASAEADRRRELAAHAAPLALSPEAAGVPMLPEAEPHSSKR